MGILPDALKQLTTFILRELAGIHEMIDCLATLSSLSLPHVTMPSCNAGHNIL
jgi:hypothetical protein